MIAGSNGRPLGVRRLVAPILGWAAVAAVLFVVQYAARAVSPGKSRALLDGWIQFDGPEYLSIVRHGYERRQLVWFPGYPTAVRVIDLVVGSPVLSAVAVSALGGLVATALFWKWTERMGLEPAARSTALAVMLLYPYGWFLFGVVYSDALFLALALGAFLLVERHRPGWAALLGACATATRPSGFAVALGLWVLWLERTGVLVANPSGGRWLDALRVPRRLDLTRWTWRSLVPLGSLSGLGLYAAYQWAEWGSPLRFVTEQGNYHEAGVSTLLKQQYFESFTRGFDLRHLLTTTAQAALLVVVIGAVPAVGRRLGWGYATYVTGLAALPLVSVSTFMGVGRYLLPAFPVFAVWGAWLSSRRRVRAVWLLTSAAALVVMTAGFARSWYLT